MRKAVGFIKASSVAADQVIRIGGEGNVEAQEIGFAQKRFAIHELRAEFLFLLRRGAVNGMINDAHGESAGAACHGLADASKAEMPSVLPEGLVPHIFPHCQ